MRSCCVVRTDDCGVSWIIAAVVKLMEEVFERRYSSGLFVFLLGYSLLVWSCFFALLQKGLGISSASGNACPVFFSPIHLV